MRNNVRRTSSTRSRCAGRTGVWTLALFVGCALVAGCRTTAPSRPTITITGLVEGVNILAMKDGDSVTRDGVVKVIDDGWDWVLVRADALAVLMEEK